MIAGLVKGVDFLAKGFFGRKEKKNEEAFDQIVSQHTQENKDEEVLEKFYPPEPDEEIGDYINTDSEEPLEIIDMPEPKPDKTRDFWEDYKKREIQKPEGFKRIEEKPSFYPKPVVSRPAQKEESFAPIFVKVDKYEEIVQNLQEIKALLRDMKGIFPLLVEIDEVKKSTIELMRVTMQNIEKDIVRLGADFLKPGFMDIAVKPVETTHISDSLSVLQSQLSSLKSELEKAK